MLMQKKEVKNFITRKIGSTVYVVGVHFSNTSKENFNDKLLRLVKADEATAQKCEVVTC
jgi:hypothetical protein